MSSEIKNTIGLLCKILNLLYKTNLKSEYFRLAKFNKTEENVVHILWNLLVKILDEDNLVIIKQKLHNLNYTRNKFYHFTEGHSESRELLLAVSFLVSVYLEDRVNKELKNSVFSENNHPFKTQWLITGGHRQFDWKKLNENDFENYKKWISGKIYSNKNTISEYQDHIKKIQEKLNKVLDLKANSNLTLYEILALKNETIGEQFLQDSEEILNILNIYTEWLKKEKYFWKWMESVLQEDRKKTNVSIQVKSH